MRIRARLAFAVALLLGAVGVGTTQAQMGGPAPGPGRMLERYFQQLGLPKEFSVTVEMQGGPMPMQSKMAVKEKKTRMEMASSPMGQMVMIHDGDANKNYMLFPASKSYMEMPTPPQTKEDEQKAQDAKVTIKELGEEQKEGHPCTKRLITIDDSRFGQPQEITVWNAKDMQNLPVRMEMGRPDGQPMAMVYKDYELKAPADSLFQIPSDYKKQAGFGGMMPPMPPPGAGGAGGEKDD